MRETGTEQDAARREDAFVAWVLRDMANRTDAYGAYGRSGSPYTCKEPLTEDVIRAHFRGKRTIGLHACGPDQTARWCCWDLDAHDGADGGVNLRRAFELAGRLRDRGCTPLVEDSNGAGGIHVWVTFGRPVPLADAHAFAQAMAPEGVEANPKQAVIDANHRFGNWVRLPGKHHKRDHWTRLLRG